MAATTLYVNAQTGSDANGSGSQIAPFKTITRALKQAVSGDTIQIAPGKYTTSLGETLPLVVRSGIVVSGNEANKGGDIVIEGGGDWTSPSSARLGLKATIVLDGNAGLYGVTVSATVPRSSGVWIESANAITPTIANCTLRSCGMEGVCVADGASPEIRENVFLGNKSCGLLFTAESKGNIHNNLFEKNCVGLETHDQASPLLQSNIVRGNDRSGMICSGSSCPLLRNNTFEINHEDGVVIINQAQPDIGNSRERGGNLLKGNGQFDLQSTSSAAIFLKGNTIDPARVKGEGIRIEDNTKPEVLPSPGNPSNPPTGGKINDSAIQPSTRSQCQATYCLRKQRAGEEAAEGTRGIEKTAFWIQIHPTTEEINQANVVPKETAAYIANWGPLGDCIANGDTLGAAKYLAPIDVETLVQWTKRIITRRQETANQLAANQGKLLKDYLDNGGLKPAASTIAVLDWAIKNNVQKEIASQSLKLGHTLLLDLSAINLSDYYGKITERLDRDQKLAQMFEEAMKIPCIGYLFLERLCFTPAGIERGELVYSVPLAPGEEVNIAHKEWANTSEEFQQIVSGYLEDFSEMGVSEKSELAESVQVQAQHTNSFNASLTASGDIWRVHVSSSLGYTTSDTANRTEQLTRNQTSELTKKASSRAKKEHKVSFTVASAAGTEDQKIQNLKNPFLDRATRVDYYQLIRKWKVDLFRYGVRMSLDLVVQDPGKDLLAKILEIRRLREQLELDLDFGLQPSDLSLDPNDGKNYYACKANAYNVSIVDCEVPNLRTTVTTSTQYKWKVETGKSGSWNGGWEVLSIDIPENYQVEGRTIVNANYKEIPESTWSIIVNDFMQKRGLRYGLILFEDNCRNTPDRTPVIEEDQPEWNGKEGRLTLQIAFSNITDLIISFSFNLVLSQKVIKDWQQKIWQKINDAVKAKHNEDRQRLKEKLVRLQDELGAQDALSLRKKEREELMKAVLNYIGLSPENYRQETNVIKLLNQGIEWENMLYILYPYFWADPNYNPQTDASNGAAINPPPLGHPYWEFKKTLDHPDLTHRAFLKAGSCRIVLTLRPGYEDAILTLYNTGRTEGLPPHPILSIGEEFKAYANINYPGIPAANPVESYRPLLTSQQQKTWERIQLLIRLLDRYFAKYQGYPGKLDDLQKIFPPQDPWKKDYHYVLLKEGSEHPFDLFTYGRDGVEGRKADSEGGSEEDEDIHYWSMESFKSMHLTQVQACDDMRLIAWLLSAYVRKYETYPTTQSGGLKDEKLLALIPLKDAWGNNFIYTYPGSHSDYDLVSSGADSKPGGTGDNADLPSWAEANLIGTWYEYTPTSALDLEFDKDLPVK